MTRDEIRARLEDWLADVLDLDQVVLKDESTAEEFADWDSVNHVRLLIKIEQELGFQFNSSDVGMVETAGELIDLIEKKLAST
jgi:acyl carrier protein